MHSCEVSSIVKSIISAYNNGLEVFRSMKGKKKRSQHKSSVLQQDEARLETSLQHRPREIRSEYHRNVEALGHRFEIGDSIAHHSLAHTLLVLNSGLINVINSALSTDDVNKRRLSQRSLLCLSETAANDALYALRQLHQRLETSHPRLPPHTQLRGGDVTKQRSNEPQRPAKPPSRSTSPATRAKTKQEKLLAKRGGWERPRPGVRSKSGSSVVSTASSQSSKTVIPSNHKRSHTSPAVMTAPVDSPKSSRTSSESSYRRKRSTTALGHMPSTESNRTSQNSDTRETPRCQSPHLIRPPSMLIVPADYFNHPQDDPPPRPPKIPLHSRPTGIRPRPPSVATFMTASTKIGEIPEHRWPDRIPQQGEGRRPMPYVIPPPLEPQALQPKKRRGFKFWKRQDREEGVQAF